MYHFNEDTLIKIQVSVLTIKYRYEKWDWDEVNKIIAAENLELLFKA